MLKKWIRRFRCRHQYLLSGFYIWHGPNGNDPASIRAQYICELCGKTVLAEDTVDNIDFYKRHIGCKKGEDDD